jgi:hypothetical protein
MYITYKHACSNDSVIRATFDKFILLNGMKYVVCRTLLTLKLISINRVSRIDK